MRVTQAAGLTAILLSLSAARADDLKSGPEKQVGGSFDVEAFTGDNRGKILCYV
jgi:hypothetical protein